MEKLTVCFKNFRRSNFLPLTMASIKHFYPDTDFHAINLCKEGPEEYSGFPEVNGLNQWYAKTMYVNDLSNIYDGKDTSGYANVDNTYYFLEGYNLIYEKFRNLESKLLILAEDHFFTNGATLKEIVENDFDLAYARWDSSSTAANASIVCLRPSCCSSIFPLKEPERKYPGVEDYLSHNLIAPAISLGLKIHVISTRKNTDYSNDGFYTNSSREIATALKEAGIL